MAKKMINTTHIEGLLYEHKLELRESGPKSKNPGTKFIMGTIDMLPMMLVLMLYLSTLLM